MPIPEQLPLTEKQQKVRDTINELYPAMPLEMLGASFEGNLEALREGLTKTNPPSQEKLLQFFDYTQLPDGPEYAIKCWYSELANKIAANIPSNSERTVALRKLMESMDCCVRARIMK